MTWCNIKYLYINKLHYVWLDIYNLSGRDIWHRRWNTNEIIKYLGLFLRINIEFTVQELIIIKQIQSTFKLNFSSLSFCKL